MRKLTVACLFLFLCSCRKERVSDNQSASQTSDQSSSQIQSKGVWPFVKDNYWAYRDSISPTGGPLVEETTNDTLRLRDSVAFQSKVYYGPDRVLPNMYYREDINDSTVETYDSHFNQIGIFFQQVDTNSTIVYKNESDQSIYLNGTNKTYHIVNELIGYTDIEKINGYDSCVKNEFIQTYSGDTVFKRIVYVKPGAGLVRMLIYEMKNETPGNLYLYFKRDLLAYKLY
jgi:hypothetical protein